MQRRRVVIAAALSAVLAAGGLALWRGGRAPGPRGGVSPREAGAVGRGVAPAPPAVPPPVRLEREGAVSAERPPDVAVEGTSTITIADDQLRERIDGVVVDQDGAGIDGVQVTVTAVPVPVAIEAEAPDLAAPREAPSAGETLTDAAGHFELAGLAPGGYDVAAAKEGYDAPSRPIRVEAGDRPVRLLLARSGVLRGRVRVEGEGPLPALTVDLLSRVPFASADVAPELDADGRFAILIRRDGPHVLRVAAEGWAPVERGVETARGVDQDVGELLLSRGRDLAGLVVDAATGAPIPAARVSFTGPERGGRAGEATVAGPDGAFVLSHVEGPVLLRVEQDGYAPGRLQVAPDEGPVVVRLGRGGAVAVRVLTAAGAPIPGADVALYTASGIARSGKTDAQGELEVAALAPGTYVVQADSETRNPGLAGRAVVVREGGRAALELRERATGTTLVLALGGPGVSGGAAFQVGLVPGDLPAGAAGALAALAAVPLEPIPGQPRLAPTFRYLEPGRYTVLVARPDGEELGLHVEPIDVGPGPQETRVVEVPAELPRVTW